MSDRLNEILDEYGINYNEQPEIVNGIIPEWAMPDEVLEQYKNWEGASESFDDTELQVITAKSQFGKAKALDEQAIRDAIVSRQPVPGHEHEAAAEAELKKALTVQRMTAKVLKDESLKLVSLMRANRAAIQAAMEERVRAVAPKIRAQLATAQAQLDPLYEELSEAMTPVALLQSLDSRQRENIGGGLFHVTKPDLNRGLSGLNFCETVTDRLAQRGAPNRIRMKDPHGNIGEHDLEGPDEYRTRQAQAHVEMLKSQGWTEVPWD